MLNLIEHKRQGLQELCEKYDIKAVCVWLSILLNRVYDYQK